MNFASDNGAGVAPEILEAIATSSRVNAPAYGADAFTARGDGDALSDVFETKVEAFLVATGTAANALALSALVRPWEAVFCHEEAHIHDDECGAPELFHRRRQAGRDPGRGRQDHARRSAGDARALSARARQVGAARRAVAVAGDRGRNDLQRRARSPSFAASRAPTASGPTWTARASPTRSCRSGASPADMTWRAGIDALSFGATKNGALACEAVVFFDPALAENFAYLRKRGGHTLSKGRFLGAQMEAYLKDGLWLRLAERANAAARRLAQRPVGCAGRAARLADARRTRCLSSRPTPRSRPGATRARSSTCGRRVRSRPSARRAPGRRWSGWSRRSRPRTAKSTGSRRLPGRRRPSGGRASRAPSKRAPFRTPCGRRDAALRQKRASFRTPLVQTDPLALRGVLLGRSLDRLRRPCRRR